MIPQETIQRWQSIWKKLLDMAYHQKGIETELFIQNTDYHDLYIWCRNEPDFYKLTFEHAWEKYNYLRDPFGVFIEPTQINGLQRMYIPNLLFDCIGINTFKKTCLSDCEISYWEDDSAV